MAEQTSVYGNNEKA